MYAKDWAFYTVKINISADDDKKNTHTENPSDVKGEKSTKYDVIVIQWYACARVHMCISLSLSLCMTVNCKKWALKSQPMWCESRTQTRNGCLSMETRAKRMEQTKKESFWHYIFQRSAPFQLNLFSTHPNSLHFDAYTVHISFDYIS